MQRVNGFTCCKIVLFSTASNYWSRLFSCFTNILHLAISPASQTFALGSLQTARQHKAFVRQEGHHKE